MWEWGGQTGNSHSHWPFVQSLLKKLEALENDFAFHETRVQSVCTQGEDILSKVGPFQAAGPTPWQEACLSPGQELCFAQAHPLIF